MKLEVVTTVDYSSLAGNTSAVAGGTGASVWERYTEDTLYAEYRPAVIAVDRAVTPIWYLLGFPGNALSLWVWAAPAMRASSGRYLAALAAGDLVFLVLHLLYELQAAWSVRVLAVPGLCQLFPVLFLASQHLSPGLVLAFTVERYIAICHPFRRERYCSAARARRCIAALVVLVLVLHSVQAYFWTFTSKTGECVIRPSVMAGGAASIWSVWSWVTELLVFGAVPLAILSLNLLVIAETGRLHQAEEKRLCLRPGQKAAGSSSSAATTLTLLAVSFYLIFTTLPVTVLYALAVTFPAGDATLSDAQIAADPAWQHHFTYYTVRTIVQELGMSHYAGNFLIYLLTGRVFRRQLRRRLRRVLLPCCDPRPGAGGGAGTAGGSAWSSAELDDYRSTCAAAATAHRLTSTVIVNDAVTRL